MKDSVSQDELNFDIHGSIYPQDKPSIFTHMPDVKPLGPERDFTVVTGGSFAVKKEQK